MTLRTARPPEIDFSTFPETDGLPNADTERNQAQMIDLILPLAALVGPRGHHAGGNLLIYYDPDDGWRHLAPDVFVALDRGPEPRATWEVWVEGKFPELVMEILSPSTQHTDLAAKVEQYAELGVQEYYIFDPAGRLDPSFHAYWRRGERLVRVPVADGVRIASALLDLEFRVVDGWLRVIDPATGEPYPTPREDQAALPLLEQARREAERARQEAEQRAAREEEARRAAEYERERSGARAAAAEAALQAALAELSRLRGQTTRPEDA